MRQICVIGTAIALAFAVNNATGQENNTTDQNTRGINFAPEIGIVQSGLHITDNEPGTSLKTGLRLGGVANINLGEHFSFQPGAIYIMKGYQLSVSGAAIENAVSNEQFTFHYVEVPANIVYYFGDIENARFMIGAGPYVSYLFSAQDRTQPQNFNAIPIGGNAPGSLRPFDFGLGGFIGCQLPKGIYFKFGGESGLAHIQQTANNGNANSNYDFQATVGCYIGYSKGREQ